MAMQNLPVLQVSELTEIIKTFLEDNLSQIRVEGELSNWRPAPSGHVYCTLKDKEAMLQAVMFKGKTLRLNFRPKDGMRVRASGNISVYAARGQYQLIIDTLEELGAGDLQALLEERKKRLAAEGLFDLDRKRPIPEFPTHVVVITSPTGAAIRDVLHVLRRRTSGLRISILPALVQGDEAPAALIRQLGCANRYKLGDVIIIGRGGGSLEDLAAFSDEALVRAVAASSIPVISAVGHETDWSLCDYAADLRAPTPSAAAELVSASTTERKQRYGHARERLIQTMQGRMDKARLLLHNFSSEALARQFERLVQPYRQRIDYSHEALLNGMQAARIRNRNRLRQASLLLQAADPHAILARGYSVVRLEGSTEAIRTSAQLGLEDKIHISFAHGSAVAGIMETTHEKL
ncbi:MAG: exodeoxyribonuclease VII large subunit [Spirochaetes bacterium]|nr:exodeoxyribonuclease VII large subunit [Spirochaetota bacterium]MBU0954607.1 exodeoxyribonuclease VII large subunit [Spirochaetota bacterium]